MTTATKIDGWQEMVGEIRESIRVLEHLPADYEWSDTDIDGLDDLRFAASALTHKADQVMKALMGNRD